MAAENRDFAGLVSVAVQDRGFHPPVQSENLVRHPTHHDLQIHHQYYEAPRHSTTGQYPQSVAAFAPYPENSQYTSYSYPAAMSLSYETQNFPNYPQSGLMHDPHQEQDDNNLQHHRYPSPPPPLSENPYNPQTMDAAAALGLGDIQELATKDESDAPSPGRSKPIPKPDREITKGEDGRYVCSWQGCTEEVQSFGRKCEWSKVCAF